MRQDFLDSAGSADPLILFFHQQLVNQVRRIRRHLNVVFFRHWECHFVLLNQEIHFVLVLVEKWRNTNKHFV